MKHRAVVLMMLGLTLMLILGAVSSHKSASKKPTINTQEEVVGDWNVATVRLFEDGFESSSLKSNQALTAEEIACGEQYIEAHYTYSEAIAGISDQEMLAIATRCVG